MFDSAIEATIEATKIQLAQILAGGEDPTDPKFPLCKAVKFLKRYAGNDRLLDLLANLVGTFNFYKEMLALTTRRMSAEESLSLIIEITATGDLSHNLEMVKEEMSLATLVGGELSLLIDKIKLATIPTTDDDLLKFIIAIWSVNVNIRRSLVFKCFKQ